MSSFVIRQDAPVWLEKLYSSGAVSGVSVLVAAATISMVAIIGMLAAIAVSSIKTGHLFIRSHLGAYFVSLILAELVQAIGSIMSARWIILRKVELGHFCATQGALKNAGNVSTALWSMVIAFHTFTLIFLRIRVVPWVFYCTLAFTWFIVGFIVILGPAALETPSRGPFWGVSGYWCWITEGYSAERFGMEYLFMFMTAGVSVVLYILIFLRLRGNIEGSGLRIIVCRARTPWQRDTSMSDPQIARVGKQMLWYPVVYVVLILPIAACRWSEINGAKVPFGVTMFADTVFLLSGLANAILYSTTRPVAPIQTIIPSYATRKTDDSFQCGENKAPGMESFESGGHAHASPRLLLSTAPDSEPPYIVSRPTIPPRETEQRLLLPGAIDDRFSSRRSSLSSVRDNGYPGPQVHPAVGQPIAPFGEFGNAGERSHLHHASGTTASLRGPFSKDWI